MFFSDEVNLNNSQEVEEIQEFLNYFNVEFDYPDKTFIIRDKGDIIATGSASANILKYFFSKEEYKGQGTMSIIYNSLLNHLLENGYDSFFVFTTPDNTSIFSSLGLKQVYTTNSVSLFEGGFYNYNNWIKKVKSNLKEKSGIRGAIVMNCNPMTLGHKYLIEMAMKEVDDLLIFIVEEDKSIFPFLDRYQIVKKEFEGNNKVEIIKGGPYIISQGTFPTYFIKKKDDMLDIYTELDGSIFAHKIAKDLEIDIRFFGSEPNDLVTLAYNENLKGIFEKEDIEIEVLDRKSIDGEAISASRVRKLLSEENLQDAYKLLPESTINYLESQQGEEVLWKLKTMK